MSTDIEYPEYVDSVETVSKIIVLLIDVSRAPWAQVGDPAVCVNLERIGTIFKNARMGKSPECRRYGGPGDGEFETFHICRRNYCKYGRIFASPEKAAAASPAFDAPAPRAVSHVTGSPGRGFLGSIIAVLGLF